jgi:hypothetical protein
MFFVLSSIFKQVSRHLRARMDPKIQMETGCASRQIRFALTAPGLGIVSATSRVDRIAWACVARSRWGRGDRGGDVLLV